MVEGLRVVIDGRRVRCGMTTAAPCAYWEGGRLYAGEGGEW
jgi:hypothetical protein